MSFLSSFSFDTACLPSAALQCALVYGLMEFGPASPFGLSSLNYLMLLVFVTHLGSNYIIRNFMS